MNCATSEVLNRHLTLVFGALCLGDLHVADPNLRPLPPMARGAGRLLRRAPGRGPGPLHNQRRYVQRASGRIPRERALPPVVGPGHDGHGAGVWGQAGQVGGFREEKVLCLWNCMLRILSSPGTGEIGAGVRGQAGQVGALREGQVLGLLNKMQRISSSLGTVEV